MILHQLHDHSNIRRIILDRDHSHDVRSIFRVRVNAILISQDNTSVRFIDLHTRQINRVHYSAGEELDLCEMALEQAFQLEVRDNSEEKGLVELMESPYLCKKTTSTSTSSRSSCRKSRRKWLTDS